MINFNRTSIKKFSQINHYSLSLEHFGSFSHSIIVIDSTLSMSQWKTPDFINYSYSLNRKIVSANH